MKTVSKKLLSILLVAILLVSAIPFQAFAEGEVTEAASEVTTEAASEVTTEASTTIIESSDADTAAADSSTTSTKVAHDENISTHVSSVWTYDSSNHWKLCPNADCELYGVAIGTTAHTYDANGVCTVCGYTCPHTSGTYVDTETVVTADCIHTGNTGDKRCSACGAVVEEGTETAATGVHNYVNYVCTVCGAKDTSGSYYTLTLDANGGTINGGATMGVSVQKGAAISTLPDPTREGYTFAGWYLSDGTLLSLGQTYNYDADMTATAKWTEVTYNLTVRRVLNGVFSTAKTVVSVNVPAGTPLLNYLNNNVTSAIQSELALNPGYTWEYNFWKDYSGTNQLTAQDTIMNQAQTVYVNFVSKSYTLYFNANGGSVTPTSKTVYFGSAVGTLPTATLSGKVFQYWKDANGTIYTADTIYQVAGDTSLTAVYQDEALVILYIYINGDFSSCNRMIVMDSFVNGNNLSRSDVYTQVAKYYTPASGTLSIAGLFDEYTWSSYRANTSKAGTENIEIDDSKVNKIYVMVNNANTSATVISGSSSSASSSSSSSTTATTVPTGSYWVSTGNGTGYWVYPASSSSSTSATTYTYVIYSGTNPKTGDTAQIEVAAAIMVLAAGALVTLIALRKKKA